MDSLTQIILGAAVGEAAIGKKVGNKAMLWGAVAGTIPDLDVFSKFFMDNVSANEVHRGFSHSILFSVIASPILGWLLSRLYKNKEANWQDWTKLVFLGLFTHPLLDIFTTWGTQLFWPLSYKISFKNIFVVDPLYTLPFLICVILAMSYNKSNPQRKKYNSIGLILSSTYLLITLGLKWYTFNKFQDSLENQHIVYKEIQAKPTPLNSILWTANVETEDSFLIGYYSVFDKRDTIDFVEYPKNHHLLGDIKNDPLISRLIKLTEGWYTIQKVDTTIFLNDLRFGLLGVRDANNFVFSYELYYDDLGKLKARERERKVENAYPLFKKLFTRILGG